MRSRLYMSKKHFCISDFSFWASLDLLVYLYAKLPFFFSQKSQKLHFECVYPKNDDMKILISIIASKYTSVFLYSFLNGLLFQQSNFHVIGSLMSQAYVSAYW